MTYFTGARINYYPCQGSLTQENLAVEGEEDVAEELWVAVAVEEEEGAVLVQVEGGVDAGVLVQVEEEEDVEGLARLEAVVEGLAQVEDVDLVQAEGVVDRVRFV
mmetsp:Transcript_13693/g.16124  ORF Transcript_13693/g.16124 Transcript_13693/m.16124 type:complete len:105 (-) Transcript_13693:115-429(-)